MAHSLFDLTADYLSWTRNAIITTVAAAAFYNVEPTASVGTGTTTNMAYLFNESFAACQHVSWNKATINRIISTLSLISVI